MQNFIFKKCTGFIYSLADRNMGHCVELNFFEGKLGGFIGISVQKTI